jgi:L-fuconolactonase
MRIDAHQHFWQLSRGDYEWITPEHTPLYRDFLPADLAPILTQAGIDGTILVQAAPTLAETEFILSLADRYPFIKGVVGWADFESPDVQEIIMQLAKHPKLVGLRLMIQEIDDADWMLKAELAPAFKALIAADLTFDALTVPHHLPNLSQLLQRYPNMRVVIDHASKPQIRSGEFDRWAGDMARLASRYNVYCKLSGLVTEAEHEWAPQHLKPYVDHLLETFGPQRLIWGSDWPVCLLASSYQRWLSVTEQLLEGVADTRGIFGANAQWAYQL